MPEGFDLSDLLGGGLGNLFGNLGRQQNRGP